MPTIRDMQQERAEIVSQARTILDTAEARPEGERNLTSEEEAEFDRLMESADTMESRISREQRARDAERDLDRVPDGGPTDPDGPTGEPGGRGGGGRGDEQDAYARAFGAYLRDGRAGLDEATARALQMGGDPTDGGYLMAPQQFVADLIEAVDDMVHIRGLATVNQLTEGESLGRPARTSDVDDAEWTSELSTGSDDDSLKFGKRELRPHPLAKRVKVSRTLLRRASIGPEAIVRARLAYKFGVSQEKAYMTGDGNQKPLGLFVASTDGISTGRDVDVSSDGANLVNDATNGRAADDLIDAKYTLKAQYHPRARWLFHRFVIRDVRKLKDDQGQYIWQPGLAGDRPDTILEIPYLIAEFAPNSFADDAYIGMLGDFSYYWIAESLEFELQRLVELYAESNQVGFIGRQEIDGMPTLEEAFVRLQSNDVVA